MTYKMTHCYIHRLVHLLTLIREALSCSRWQLKQRTQLVNVQRIRDDSTPPYIGCLLYHIQSPQGPMFEEDGAEKLQEPSGG